MIADLISSDRSQPSREAVGRALAPKTVDSGRNGDENLLDGIGRVGWAKPSAPAPSIDAPAIEIDKPLPRLGPLRPNASKQCRRDRIGIALGNSFVGKMVGHVGYRLKG